MSDVTVVINKYISLCDQIEDILEGESASLITQRAMEYVQLLHEAVCDKFSLDIVNNAINQYFNYQYLLRSFDGRYKSIISGKCVNFVDWRDEEWFSVDIDILAGDLQLAVDIEIKRIDGCREQYCQNQKRINVAEIERLRKKLLELDGGYE